ncbi:MAG: hypothetical protein HYU66_03685 [Armatimonadetes bacterium]|nr:hypothetical protein [Armatimonadota bacterium]
MVADLLRSNRLAHATKAQIRALLGPPDYGGGPEIATGWGLAVVPFPDCTVWLNYGKGQQAGPEPRVDDAPNAASHRRYVPLDNPPRGERSSVREPPG